ncbi:MAG: aminomethyl transferase family protein, partial [Gammaproteobacteria bacterium]|nr:aminomethyl transferase family protein [Gammaproteobacteria bacterium]
MAKRVSALDGQVRALGAKMGEWNDMAVAFGYPNDPHLEHDAIRETVGTWDASSLTKIRVRGPAALSAIDYLVTRDMSKIYIGKAGYCPILKDDGHFCDDGYIYRIAEDEFLVVSSIGPALELLEEYARARNLSVERDEDLHVITVQGPKSVELLDAHTGANLYDLVFCHHMNSTLFGKNTLISRTGYSGERGYEIFLPADEAVSVWQELMHYGQPLGLRPISFGG